MTTGLLRKKSILAAKIETAAGVAESLAAGNAGFNVFNMKWEPIVGVVPREGQASFSSLTASVETLGGKFTFETEAQGDGAGGIPAWASTFLPACGWVASSQVYSPKSAFPGASVKTLTMGGYVDGTLRVIYGACGAFVVTLAAGKVPRFAWTFTGLFTKRTDVALIAPTYPTALRHRFANSNFTIGSWAPVINQITFDSGNVVALGESPAGPTGYYFASIRDRKVKGKLDPQASTVASNDVDTAWINETEQALSLPLDNGVDVMQFAAPKLQLINVGDEDRNGLAIDDIDFQCNRSAAAGDDELTIAFAAHT